MATGTGRGVGHYVGRVGALAVALGVGVAVITGQGAGVARADDTTSSPSDDTNESTPAVSESIGTTPAAPTVNTPSTTVATGSPTSTTPGHVSTPSVPTMNIGLSGTATLSGDAEINAQPVLGDPKGSGDIKVFGEIEGSGDIDETVDPPIVGVPAPAVGQPTGSSTSANAAEKNALPNRSVLPNFFSLQRDPTASTAELNAGSAPLITPPTAPTGHPLGIAVRALSLAAPLAATTSRAAATAPTLKPQDPVSALISLPGAILAAVLSPFLAHGPTAPSRPPLLLAVLSLVAREIQRVLFNSSPVARSQDVTLTLQDADDVSDPIRFGARDFDHDPLIYTVPARGQAGGPTHGTVTVDQASGTFVYNPDDAFAAAGGEDTFTYTVTDAAGGSHLHGLFGLLSFGHAGHTSTATVTISVAAVNDPPIAEDDAVETDEDTVATGNVLTNDTDVDSPSLTVALSAGPTNGTVDLRPDGTFTYTPKPNFNGTDSFTYTVSDGRLTDEAVATISVKAVEDPVVAVGDTVTLTEDGAPVSGNVLTNDRDRNPDGPAEPLTVTPVGFGSSAVGTLNIDVDGAYTYTPAADFNGTIIVPYTVSDGTSTAKGTLTIIVTAVNDPIEGSDDKITIDEDSPMISGNLLTNDSGENPDGTGEDLAVTNPGTIANQLGTLIVQADGEYTFTPSANQSGVFTHTYTVSDGTYDSSAVITITVTAQNDPVLPARDTADTPEDTPLTGNVLINDLATNPDGPTEKLTVIGGSVVSPEFGTIVMASNGAYTYTPRVNYYGTFTVPFSVTDDTTTSPSSLTITVTPVNDPITGVRDAIAIDEDSPTIRGNLLANDRDQNPDGTDELLTIVGAPVGTTINALGTLVVAANGDYAFTPAANQSGSFTFQYAVTDGTSTGSGVVAFVVNPRPDPITAINDAITIKEDSPTVTGSVLTNDRAQNPDGSAEVLTVTPVGAGSSQVGFISIAADGTYTFTPAPNFYGTVTLPYRVSDGTSTSTATLTITVESVNDAPSAPVIAFNPLTPNEITGVVNGTATSTDVDNVTLVYSGSTTTLDGSVVVVNPNGSFTYQPSQLARENALAQPTETFTIRVSDGTATVSKLVTVTVAPVNVVIDTVTVGRRANGIALTPDGSRAYVTNQEGDTVSVVNTITNAVITTITVGDGPTSIVMDRNGRAYVTNQVSDTVSVIDTDSNTVIAVIAVGDNPVGMAISPDGKHVYTANRDGKSVSVIDTATNSVTNLPMTSEARGVTVSADNTRIYVTLQNVDEVVVVNPATNAVVATIKVGDQPNRITLAPDGSRAYVTNELGNTVSVISLLTNKVVATINVGAGPNVLVVSPDGSRVYVTSTTNFVTVIATEVNRVIGTIDVGAASRGAAFNPDGTLLYVSSGVNTGAQNGSFSTIVIGALGAKPITL